eukprot:TRINITY_DN6642_c0_g1_i3.p1 TRINITY_DN6642_c0_g1~~TRINITY_DN6642_c0_g1_i3.p1  ORF type:complete len:168 (+),score=38.89 TRINITY_DN6642_c0_g1_i3:443-946(+)
MLITISNSDFYKESSIKFTCDVDPDHKIDEIRQKIAETAGVAPEKIILMDSREKGRRKQKVIEGGVEFHYYAHNPSIFVRTLTNTCAEIEVDFRETILELKKKIEERLNIPAARQKLIFAGKLLQDNEKTLVDYNAHECYTSCHLGFTKRRERTPKEHQAGQLISKS